MTTDRIPAVLRPAILRFARTPGRHAARIPAERRVMQPEPPVVQAQRHVQRPTAQAQLPAVPPEATTRQAEIYCWS